MLTRVNFVAVAALLTAAFGYIEPAFADEHDPPIVVNSGDSLGIETSVTTPGTHNSQTGVAPVSTGSTVRCTYKPDTSNHSSGIPEWEVKYPHTGEEGAWFFRQCTNGSFNVIWIPSDSSPAGAPGVTLGQLATQAANYLPLPAPQVHHNPEGSNARPQTVVGIDTWFWVSPSSFTRLEQTTSAGGITATVVAEPVATAWASGSADARDVVCDGPGVAYNAQRPATAQTTYCSTKYSRSSASQPQTGPHQNDRFFVGTATTIWRVTWTGSGGAAGSLPDLRRSTPFRLAVAELQAVN